MTVLLHHQQIETTLLLTRETLLSILTVLLSILASYL